MDGPRQLYASAAAKNELASVLRDASFRRALVPRLFWLSRCPIDDQNSLISSLLDLNAGRRLGTTPLRSGALLHNAHNMPTARSKALAARAGRSFIDPVKQTLPSERAKAQEEGLVTVWSEDSSSGWRITGQPRPLVVLDKNGQWRPARSLYEYVQQNVIEICAAKIHHDEHGEPPSDENNYTEAWEDATEVYAKPVGLKTSGGIDTFISDITFGFAGFIVEQRRNEESAMRYLRVIARRVNVPDDCLKHVEAFAGLLPARDAVPCRREQLPAFMQRLYELKMDEIYRNNSHFDRLSLKSGHAGGAEVWTGFSGGDFSTSHWTVLPRKFVPQYRELPASMGIDMSGEVGHGNPEDCLDECESEAPGYKTFVYGEIDWENNTYVNCYTKTFPWFEEVSASSAAARTRRP